MIAHKWKCTYWETNKGLMCPTGDLDGKKTDYFCNSSVFV